LIKHLIGQTKSKKILDEVHGIYQEEFYKQFPEYFAHNYTKSFALVTILEKKEIKKIGMSKIDDLLLDNWANFFKAIISNEAKANMFTTGNVLKTPSIFSSSLAKYGQTGNGAVGTSVSVGTGLTTPQRNDFNMETATQGLISGDGGWNSGLGKVDIPSSVLSNQIQSISEVGLFGIWFHNTPNIGVATFMLSHDLISPVVPVIIGETINVDYEMLFS